MWETFEHFSHSSGLPPPTRRAPVPRNVCTPVFPYANPGPGYINLGPNYKEHRPEFPEPPEPPESGRNCRDGDSRSPE